MPSSGTLTVRTYTSDAQLPVSGATVTITQPTDNGMRLIATRITDRNGLITPVRIVTPDKIDSESPAAPNAPIPWTNVDIAIDHPDYDRVLVENAQIFAGIDTMQNIKLLPLQVNPDLLNMTEVVNTPPQSL